MSELYRRGKPAVEEPIHWQWLDDLIYARVLEPVTINYLAAGAEWIRTQNVPKAIRAALGVEDTDEGAAP